MSKEYKTITKEQVLQMDRDEQKKYYKWRIRRIIAKSMKRTKGHNMVVAAGDLIDEMVEVGYLTEQQGIEKRDEIIDQINQFKGLDRKEILNQVKEGFKQKVKFWGKKDDK